MRIVRVSSVSGRFIHSTVALAVLLACSCGSSKDKGGANGQSGGPGGESQNRDPGAAATFVENFTYKGTHAAVVNDGKGTTTFWDSQNWDVTGDTHALGMAPWTDTPYQNAFAAGVFDTNSGHSVYVHKAAGTCDASGTAPCSALVNDETIAPGGDGTPGIGVMHLDMQDIVGARLRIPIVISNDKPGIVRLRAPRFVTTGHWWEIILTPADRVIGAENTVIESQGLGDGTGDSRNVPTEKGAGPGHDPQEESYNFLLTGAHDFACRSGMRQQGLLSKLAVKTLFKDLPAGMTEGYRTATGFRYNAVNPKDLEGEYQGDYQHDYVRPGIDGLKPPPADMMDGNAENIPRINEANRADEFTLYLWQLEFRHDGLDVLADFNDGRGLAKVEHFNVGVPWSTVHVHLNATAYQNDHHPQFQPCYAPNPYTKRDMRFATVQISPTKFTKVAVFPPDGAPVDSQGNVMACNGQSCGKWRRYDMRDTHSFGPPDTVTVNGVATELPRPNKEVFSFGRNYIHGSSDFFKYFGGLDKESSFDLYVPDSEDIQAATAANLVYNVVGARGDVELFVNGVSAGKMKTADSVIGAWVRNDIAVDQGCPDYTCMSVRRSISIDPKLLRENLVNGLVHLQVVFGSEVGSGTFLDRLELEVMH